MIRFCKREDGSASIEFVFLFPLFVSLLLMSIETGTYMARHVMLDRSVDLAVRELRLGTSTPPTFQELKTQICDNTILVTDCDGTIQIEMQPVDTVTWVGLSGPPKCRDVTSSIDPFDATSYNTGLENEIIMIQVCALVRPFFPTTTLGLGLVSMGDRYAIVVKSSFVNEPAS